MRLLCANRNGFWEIKYRTHNLKVRVCIYGPYFLWNICPLSISVWLLIKGSTARRVTRIPLMTICGDRNIEIKGAQRAGGTTFDTNMFEVYYKIYKINCVHCGGILFIHVQHIYKICFLIEIVWRYKIKPSRSAVDENKNKCHIIVS